MLQAFLLVAAGASVLEGVVSRAAFKWSGKKFYKVSVSSELALSEQEIEQWQSNDLDDGTRAAIFKRGLLRSRLTR